MVQKVLIRRTEIPNSPPAGLAPGELSVEMADPLRLWVGVPTAIDATGKRLLVPSAPEVPPAFGQCRLWNPTAAQLQLLPWGGNQIKIDGALHTIPSPGPTLANAGLPASTLQYIYVYDAAGTLTLEASATGHATGADGVEIKTGDATRTLVGMVRTDAASQFFSDMTARLVRSWFNRQTEALDFHRNLMTFATHIGTGTGIIIDPYLAVPLLTWANESVVVCICVTAWTDLPSTVAIILFGLDGVQQDNSRSAMLGTSDNSFNNYDATTVIRPSIEGYHTYEARWAATISAVITAGHSNNNSWPSISGAIIHG